MGEMMPPPRPPGMPPPPPMMRPPLSPATRPPSGMPPPPPVMRPPQAAPEQIRSKQSAAESAAAEDAKMPQKPYHIPEWSHAPGKSYTLEVLKEGSIIEELQVSEKGAYMFGRHENCDFVLDHPSISRHHAVLQYNQNGDAFIFDLNSTHGTFVNKLKVKGKVHVPIHVGNIIRFGLSTRLYVFQGPQELMPQEGLSRRDRQIVRQLEAQQVKEDEEASVQRARIDAANGEGATWGMAEDAVEEEKEEDDLTWQTYKGQLNEKQQKTLEQIQKRNDKLTNLKKEIDAIQAKEVAQGGLTQGQQTQIARNEKRIEELLEQLENLEETLNDSIKESVRGKPGGKRKKKNDEDEDDDISDDEFYDRTKKKQKKNEQAESAESLLEKIEQQTKEMDEIRLKLAAELDKPVKEQKEEEAVSDDPLDAFMTNVSTEIVEDDTARMKKDLQRLQEETQGLSLLLKVADPTGELTSKWKAKKEQGSKKPEQDISESKQDIPKSEQDIPKSTQESGALWIGAPREEHVDDETSSQPQKEEKETDGADDGFVQYKDRMEGLQKKEGDEVDQTQAAVAENIALLLKHTKGLRSSPEREESKQKTEEAPKVQRRKKQKKSNKRTLGPERPDFINQEEETEFETWVPPTGQTGDGKTALNEKYGY